MGKKEIFKINKEKEQFRLLANQLQEYKEQGKKCIAFTSTTTEQGKTYVIQSIAKRLAKSGHKVVIVDANLMDTTLTKLYAMTKEEGINGIIEKIQNDEVHSVANDQRIKELGPNLYFIPLGYTKRLEDSILHQEKGIKELFKRLYNEFEYVLVEVPSFECLSLTQILTRAMDACILVVKAGQIEKNNLTKTMGMIDSLGCEVVSCILNKKEDIVYKIPKVKQQKSTQRTFFRKTKKSSVALGEEIVL